MQFHKMEDVGKSCFRSLPTKSPLLHFSFCFNNFHMPYRAEVFVHISDKLKFMGAEDSRDLPE